MSRINGEKSRAAIARRRRTAQRLKDRARVAELKAGSKPAAKSDAKPETKAAPKAPKAEPKPAAEAAAPAPAKRAPRST